MNTSAATSKTAMNNNHITSYPKIFRKSKLILVASVLSASMFILVAFMIYSDFSIISKSIAFGMLAIGGAGIVEALYCKTTLYDDQIHIRKIGKNEIIKRDDIISVSCEKGCPLWLILKDRKVEVNGSIHANTLRSWIKRRD